MKTINLREIYPYIQTQDYFCEVSDEIAEAFLLSKRSENNYKRKMYRYRAHYSLDRDDGIENDVLSFIPSAEDVVIHNEERAALYAAIRSLTAKQQRRIYCRFFLGMRCVQIARLEGVSSSTISKSINTALYHLEKILKDF